MGRFLLVADVIRHVVPEASDAMVAPRDGAPKGAVRSVSTLVFSVGVRQAPENVRPIGIVERLVARVLRVVLVQPVLNADDDGSVDGDVAPPQEGGEHAGGVFDGLP
jgi:hypothetical protein